jgi:hypothetical protein
MKVVMLTGVAEKNGVKALSSATTIKQLVGDM